MDGNKMSNFTKEELYTRGWTDEKIKYLLTNPYCEKNGEPAWEGKVVERTEKTISYQNFVNSEIYLRTLDKIESEMKIHTEQGMVFSTSLTVNYNDKNNLLSHLNDYDNLSHIIHFAEDNFQADPSKSYTLFTDGCFKNVGRESFSSCAGWILENETQKIVAEFSKQIPLDDNKTRSMPEFELTGIFEGVKLIKKLGLKNVSCYTDSVGEANIILSAIHGIGEKRFQNNREMYGFILDVMLETGSTISWIPREYNSHADRLTKIPLNIWYEKYKKDNIEKDYFQENGYVINKNLDIFFKVKESDDLDGELSLMNIRGTQHNVKKIVNLMCLHNSRDGSIEVIHHQDDEDFKEMGVLETKDKSLSGSIVVNFIKGLRLLKDCPQLNLEVSNGMYAIMKNMAPISTSLQEEYFELHKAIKEFPGKIKIKKMPMSRLHELSQRVGEDGFGIRKKKKHLSS